MFNRSLQIISFCDKNVGNLCNVCAVAFCSDPLILLFYVNRSAHALATLHFVLLLLHVNILIHKVSAWIIR